MSHVGHGCCTKRQTSNNSKAWKQGFVGSLDTAPLWRGVEAASSASSSSSSLPKGSTSLYAQHAQLEVSAGAHTQPQAHGHSNTSLLVRCREIPQLIATHSSKAADGEGSAGTLRHRRRTTRRRDSSTTACHPGTAHVCQLS